jgi:putative transposase
MTHQDQSNARDEVVHLLAEHGFDGMAQAFETLFNEAMKLERSAVLGAAPYERTDSRRGYANGFKPKTVTSRLGKLHLQVPQTRGVEFYPSALERGERSERALKLALAEMYVQGVSTRKVAAITRELCGHEVSSMQVSRAAEALDAELETWRQRPLGPTPYVILDARYEKVRHGGSVIDCAVLIAIGITTNGKRSVLGVSVSLSEAETHWRTFLKSLIDRGLHGVRMIASDDHAGLGQARKACFPSVPWQRCQFHLMQNAMHYVPKLAMREEVGRELRAVWDAADRSEAERQLSILVNKYQATAPDLAGWMEANVPEGLTVFALPPEHRRRLRTSNLLERLNEEIKRRTRVATLFPNADSLLRLVTAILQETSEEWETAKVYLAMETN